MMPGRTLVGLVLAAATLLGCDPGAGIAADNAASQPLIMVYRDGSGDGMAYLVPAESSVNLLPVLGGANGVIDVYTAECRLLSADHSVRRLGITMIAVDASLNVSSRPAEAADVGELPGAKALGVGVCQ